MGGNRRNRGNGRANGSSRGKGEDNNNSNAAVSVESLPSSPTSSIPTVSSSVTPTSALSNGNFNSNNSNNNNNNRRTSYVSSNNNNNNNQMVNSCSSVFTGTSTPSSQQIPIQSLPGQQEMSATRVYVRVRPFNQRERDLASASANINSESQNVNDSNKNMELLGRVAKVNMTLHSTMQINSTNPSAITTLDPTNNFMPKTTYYFEKCFDSVAVVDKSLEEVTVNNLSCIEMTALCEDQHVIYTEVGLPVLKSALDGYNGCIFAYGQTGSGKTYTMMGPSSEFANVAKDALVNNNTSNHSTVEGAVTQLEGIIPRLARELFASLREKRNYDSAHSFRVELEYFEIYNEKVIDLLTTNSTNSSNSNELRVRNSSQGPYIENLTRKHVESEVEIVKWLRFGNAERHTASTKMNERSSRSHAILSLHLVQVRISEDDVGSRMTSKVNLVDLAGSERTGMSGAVGAHFNEAVKINLSLTTLGRVIDALADLSQGKRNIFCPYRDSNLTWILMDSLGGNSKTSMIATISPHPVNFEEANQTLRYAARAKQIVAKVIVNEDPQIRQIKLLTAEVQRLQHLLNGEVNTDDYVDELRERVGLLQASLEEKEMVIAQHEAELDALHNLNSKLQAANDSLQTSATGRELSRLRIELAKMKEENVKTSAIHEQNKILQSKLEEVTKQNTELERQLKLQEKQTVPHDKVIVGSTIVAKDELSSATIEMLQEMHMKDVNVDNTVTQVNLLKLVEELTLYGYKTHKLLSDAQSANMALIHKYQHELSDEVHKREAREWDVLRELGKQLLQRHSQAAESMAALRSVHSQLAISSESNTRNNNNSNDRQWKQMLKEKEEQVTELGKVAEKEKRELERKINELNEMNTRLNLELRQVRIDWRREKEKHESKEQKLQIQVSNMSNELRSLKASLTASPNWNKNSFASTSSGNNLNSTAFTQRVTKDINNVTTAKAAPSGRPSLINASFAFTPRVPRSANILRNNNNNNKNKNSQDDMRTTVSSVVGNRGRSRKSIQSTERRDGSHVISENDISSDNNNNLFISPVRQEREESNNDAHRSVCQPVSPRHSRSRSTVQPPTPSHSHSHSILSHSSSLSSLSSELYEIQEHAEHINSLYENMIAQLISDEVHERMCITENEFDFYNVMNAWTAEGTVQLMQFLHEMEIKELKLTEQHNKFVEEERELVRNTVKEEEENKWSTQLHEVHDRYVMLHSMYASIFEELQEQQCAAFVEHEKVWSDAVQFNLLALQQKITELEQENIEMIEVQDKEKCLQEQEMQEVHVKYNAEMSVLRNDISTMQNEAKFLQASYATLQAESQLHKQMHMEQIKLMMSEEQDRINVVNQENTMFYTLTLQSSQESEKIKENNVKRMKEAAEELLQHAKEELHINLSETQEELCKERQHVVELEKACQCISALLQLTEKEACARAELISSALANTCALCSKYLHFLHKEINLCTENMQIEKSNAQNLIAHKHKEWLHEQMILQNTVAKTYFADEEKTCRANLHALACEQFTHLCTHHYNKLLLAAHNKELASMKECKEAMERELHEELHRVKCNLYKAEEMWAEKVKLQEEEAQKVQVELQNLQCKVEEAQSTTAKMKNSMEEDKLKFTEELRKQSELHETECANLKNHNEELLVKLRSAETRVNDHSANEARLRKELNELSHQIRLAKQQFALSRRVTLREQEESIRHQCERDELLARVAVERSIHAQLQRKSKTQQHMVQEAFDHKMRNWEQENNKLTSCLERSEIEKLSLQSCIKELEETLINAQSQITIQTEELSELHSKYKNEVQMHATLSLEFEELQNRLNIKEAETNTWATSLHAQCRILQSLNNTHQVNYHLLMCVQELERAESNSRYELCHDEQVSVDNIWHEFAYIVLFNNLMLSERVEKLLIMNEEKEHSWNEVNEKKDNEIARLQEDLEFNANLYEYDECNTSSNQLIANTVGKSGIMGNRSESKIINISNNSFAVNALDMSNVESTSAPRTSRDNDNVKTDTSSISFTPRPVTPRAFSYNTPPGNKKEIKGNSNRGYLSHLIEAFCNKCNNSNIIVNSGSNNSNKGGSSISSINNNNRSNESTLISVSRTNSINKFAEHAMQSANSTLTNDSHPELIQEQETSTPVHEFTLANMFSRRGSTLTNLVLPDKLNYEINNNNNNINNNKKHDKSLHASTLRDMKPNNENELMPEHSLDNNSDETMQHSLVSVASRTTREMEKQRAISLHDFLASGQMDNNNSVITSTKGCDNNNSSTLTKSRVAGRIHKKSHTPNLTLGYDVNSSSVVTSNITMVDTDKNSGVYNSNTNSNINTSSGNNHTKISSAVINKRGIIPRNVHGSNAGLASINSVSDSDFTDTNKNANEQYVNRLPSNTIAKTPVNVHSTPINDEYNEEAEIVNDVPELPLQWRKESQINEINGNNKNKFVNNNSNTKDNSSKSGKYLKREAVYTQLNTHQAIQRFGGKENEEA